MITSLSIKFYFYEPYLFLVADLFIDAEMRQILSCVDRKANEKIQKMRVPVGTLLVHRQSVTMLSAAAMPSQWERASGPCPSSCCCRVSLGPAYLPCRFPTRRDSPAKHDVCTVGFLVSLRFISAVHTCDSAATVNVVRCLADTSSEATTPSSPSEDIRSAMGTPYGTFATQKCCYSKSTNQHKWRAALCLQQRFSHGWQTSQSGAVSIN